MINKQTRINAPAPVHQNSLAIRFGQPLRTMDSVALGTSSNDMYAVNPVQSTPLPPSRPTGLFNFFK